MEKKNTVFDYLLYTILTINIIVLLISGYEKLVRDEEEILANIDNPDPNSYVVGIELNGSDRVESRRLICTKNDENQCIVHLPMAYRKDGKVMGYSTSPYSIEPEYSLDSDINLTNNMRLYVISFKINNLYIDDDDIDFIAKKNLSCVMYNNDKSCKVKLPVFNKIGYENKGYSSSIRSLTGFVYPNDYYELDEDKVLYPIYATSARHKTINVGKTLMLNDSFVEIEKGCSEDVYNDYLNYLNDIKESAPYLLFGNKISLIGDDAFNEIWGNMYVGMNFGPRKIRAIDIRCSNRIYNDYYATMVHELSHSWDYYYSTKSGTNITSESDVINLYNKYVKLDNRPFRDYSYSNVYEFFADAVKYYYFKYLKPTDEYSMLSFPSDIKNVIEKYICIANNDYKDGKCK